ncbi:MAG TPA: MlaD family protein [Conexibacter sp.]|jgi:virulence factor Mce-like protein
MRRLLAIALILVAAGVVLVAGTGARSQDTTSGGTYLVRAIFDNAGFLVPGEDVKVSGVVVGSVDSLSVTPENKAAIVLKITDPAFKDFKQDARCAVRLQSLLGEKYVDCTPTQPKATGQAPSPPLRAIASGTGKGQYLLPLSHTSSPVDLDLLNNVMRQPEQQRLQLILNEFGTGVAGNGDQLRAVIRRADPALDGFDRFLRILGDQNRVIARLADDSDVSLAPLARENASISNFIDKAGQTAAATAERGDALERNFELFPHLLQQLQPTLARLQGFTDAASPVLANLRTAAPSLNQIFEQLGPFSEAALPTFRTLGDAAEVSRRALTAARPVIQDLRGLANETGPLASNLASGLDSLRRQRGIERFMWTVLGFSGALNGEDSVGHYARSQLYLDPQCFTYTVDGQGCFSNFGTPTFAASDTTSTATISDTSPSSSLPQQRAASSSSAIELPQIGLSATSDASGDVGQPPAAGNTDESAGDSSATADDAGAGSGGRPADSSTGAANDATAGVLGYLLGSEAAR